MTLQTDSLINQQFIEFECIPEIATVKNEENGFAILKARADKLKYPHLPRDDYGRTAILGSLAALPLGQKVIIVGKMTTHSSFGRQVEVEHFTFVEPKDVTEIQRFLSIKTFGIGPVISRRIVDKFGEKTLEIMDTDPDKLVGIEGIGQHRLASIKEMWKTQRHLRNVLQFCSSVGVGAAISMKLFLKYGDKTEIIVRKDPYRMARDISGVGFATADEIAKRLGVEELSDIRIRAAAYHLIEEDMQSKGDCFCYMKDLVSKTTEFLEHPMIATAMVQAVVDEACSSNILVLDDGKVYTPTMHASESDAARLVGKLAAFPLPKSLSGEGLTKAMIAACESSAVALDDVQTSAIQRSISSKVSVITGGPGVGKTTILKALVAGISSCGIDVHLMAPTGRAAKRMTEVIGKNASTIHRILFALIKEMEEGGRSLESVQLRGAIVIDEFSMVDINLFARLLKFIHPSAMLVMIGDIDQLPPVGPGSVLRDMLSCEVIRSTCLTKIYRQAQNSTIITSAHAINEGKMPHLHLLSRNGILPSADMLTYTHEDAGKLASMAIYFATEFAQALGFDPRKDVQLLSPMHRGDAGVGNLNIQMQQKVNPNPSASIKRYENEYWGVNDRLMNIKNDYQINLMNGDLCHIVGFNDDSMIINCDNVVVEVPKEKYNNFRLAYASTVHKVQGSEFPCVIMVLHTGHFTLLQRNLLYTGITRSRTKVILCASPKALSMAIQNDSVTRRNSHLSQRIIAAIAASPEQQHGTVEVCDFEGEGLSETFDE